MQTRPLRLDMLRTSRGSSRLILRSLLMPICVITAVALSATTLFGVGVQISPTASVHPGVDPGEWLLGELNCSACHSASPTEANRLNVRHSPVLIDTGSRVTPQFLRSFLNNPQSEKPGTLMPDVLHGLSPNEKSKTIDALTHYLTSLRSTNPPSSFGASPHLLQQGQQLYHSVGCVACHAPQTPSETLSPEAFTSLQSSSIPLGNLARKTTVDALANFLQDPLKARPSGRMPSLNLTRGESLAIATYLLRDQATHGPKGPAVKLPGLQFDYYEKLVHSTEGLEGAVPTLSGSVQEFTLSPKRRNEGMGFRFTGTLTVSREGSYTFFVSCDDGAKLWIDGQVIVDNDGVHSPSEKSGKTALKAGDHPIALLYFNEHAGGELTVRWQEEGHGKRPIPATALSHASQAMEPLDPENLVLDATKVAHGEALFSSLGCAACHVGGPLNRPAKAPALATLKASNAGGCLESPRSGVPQFALSDEQRLALVSTVGRVAQLSQPLDDKSKVARTMAAMNCTACHSRDGMGGPSQARDAFFSTANHEDLGDEGRMPPHLSGVGSKLRKDWIQKVLFEKAVVRPYMATRMPQFGRENLSALPDLLSRADGSTAASQTDSPPSAMITDAKFGRQLVGTTGLSCIACHVFAGHKSLGVPALDLTTVVQRLQHDWFAKYLVDPASLRPGTRMPSFWPEGKAANKDILNGDTSHQIESIWAYLSAGKAARLPEGLVPVGAELIATQEAVIYRHFIEGAGSRSIGVGYPEKANLAFDANQLRLAMVWHGKFIDAGKHRRDRGEGYQGPLGDDVLRLPEGAPFARLASPDAPWPAAVGKPAGYQMKGYHLDALQRPSFRYTFNGMEVEDYPIAFAREPEPGLKRQIRLHADSTIAPLYFRAAIGQQIQSKADGFVIDNRLTLRFQLPPGITPMVRKSGSNSELLIPITTTGHDVTFTEELTW